MYVLISANVSESASSCEYNGVIFPDGANIPSPDICTDCFCIGGERICAILECEAPGPRCSPVEVSLEKCCPDVYDCSEYQLLC